MTTLWPCWRSALPPRWKWTRPTRPLLSAQAGLEAAQASLNSARAGIQSAQVGGGFRPVPALLYNLTAPHQRRGGGGERHPEQLRRFRSGGLRHLQWEQQNGHLLCHRLCAPDPTPGQAVTVTYNGQSYEGAVTEIGGVVDAQVGQFRVKAIIDGAQDLPDGLAVELTTTAHQVTGAVLIPSDAMFFESGVSYVYVVQDGKAVRSDVTIGLYTADTIAVTSGLTLGDEVITTWSSSLRDGVSVQTAAQTEDSESAQADPAASGPEAEG